jgi:hypothetical protein
MNYLQSAGTKTGKKARLSKLIAFFVVMAVFRRAVTGSLLWVRLQTDGC